MKMSAKELSKILEEELNKGYDVVRIARFAFNIYFDPDIELDGDLDDKVMQLVAMEEGPEFEYTEEELRCFIRDMGKL